jgi:hypothetical protein
MRKAKICFLLLFLCCLEMHSRQWIVFFAKEGFFDGVFRQSFGHAYVALIVEDPVTGKKVLADCFGFYPKGGIQSDGLIGFMDGEMRDDVGSMREYDFAVEISPKEFQECLKLKEQWSNKKYSLRANNCIDFMKDYCKVISSIKTPDGFFLLASTFIKSLREKNKDLERREILRHVVEMDKLYKLTRYGFIKIQHHKIHEKFKKLRLKKLKMFSRDMDSRGKN